MAETGAGSESLFANSTRSAKIGGFARKKVKTIDININFQQSKHVTHSV